MIKSPKLTVVIPVYNGESYIQRCLNSVLNQSMTDIQIIVVDDGSHDKTVESITRYEQQYSNLTIVRHPQNLGTGAARNTGLFLANGEFISFLDADDWVDTNTYIEMITNLEKTNADIAICGIRTEQSNSILSSIRYSYPHSNLISSNFALRLLCKTEMQDALISPMVGNKVFRLEFLKSNAIRFPPRCHFEDDEFMFLAFCHANKVILVPQVYQHYFQHASSAMHSFSTENIDCLLQTFHNIKVSLSSANCFSEHIEEYFAFLDRCLSSLLDTLFSCEQSVYVQRKYILYLFEGLLQSFGMQELLSYIDPSRIHRIWLRS